MKRRAVPLLLATWDTGWKIVAVRRAWKRRDYRWLAPLTFMATGGILPIVYLVRTHASQPAEPTTD